MCISVLTAAELRYGLATKAVSRQVQATLEAYLSKLTVLPWTEPCVGAYAELRVLNESSGKTISTMDLLIAAQVRAERATLVTSDRTLAEIDGIGVLRW